MSGCKIYLDESGDLGFTFDKPYRNGGSSRHLTLGAVICPDDSSKYIARFVADFYAKRGIAAGKERKWSEMKPHSRLEFATLAAALQSKRGVIRYATITAYKQNVAEHIRQDPNKLYNFMAGLLLVPVMKGFEKIDFYPDARSVKVKTGRSIEEYLTQQLRAEGSKTILQCEQTDGSKCRELHFTDWVCGVSQAFFEDGHGAPMQALEPRMLRRKLYFPN